MSGNKKRLWVVSELYFPEQTSTGYFLTEIAEGLAKEYDVQVLCGLPSYSERGIKTSFREERNGTSIHRLKSTHFNKDRLLLKALNSVTLTVAAFVFALRNFRKDDRILVVTNPPILPLAVGIVSRRKEMKSYLLVHDVYPEVLVATGFLKPTSFIYTALQRLFSSIYELFDNIVVLGRDMEQLVQDKVNASQKISIIPNWGDLDEIFPIPAETNPFSIEHGLIGKTVIQFSGNIGRTHDIETILKVAHDLKHRHDIVFLFVGYGGKMGLVEDHVNVREAKNIRFLPRQPREKLGAMLSSANATIVSFVDNMLGLSVPSRMYNILSAGVPIIAIADPRSELSLFVSENDAGWVLPTGNAEQLKQTLLTIADKESSDMLAKKSQNSRKAVDSDYSLEFILQKYLAILADE